MESTGWPAVPKLRTLGLSIEKPQIRLGGHPLHRGKSWEKRNANIQVTRPLSGLLSSPSPGLEAPAFPTVGCLVHFGMSNTSTRFLPSSRTFHSSPLPSSFGQASRPPSPAAHLLLSDLFLFSKPSGLPYLCSTTEGVQWKTASEFQRW